jgi:hypothetical protein
VVQITEEEDGEKENMGNDKTADWSIDTLLSLLMIISSKL